MTIRAVVLSAHPWTGTYRLGCHHLAMSLARRGADVLYVSGPLSSVHIPAILASERTRARFAEMARGCIDISVEHGRLRALTPFSLLPLAAKLGADNDFVLRSWPTATLPGIVEQIGTLGFLQPDLALFDGPLQAALHPRLAPIRAVLRMFDRFSHMAGATPALLRAARDLADIGAWVAYSAHDLESDARELAGGRTIFLPNGVDAAAFAARAPLPQEYRTIPVPRVVYVGQTGALFDADLVGLCAQRSPAVHVVVIGPVTPRLAALARKHPNIHALGPRLWEQLPGYLQHADLGLTPFDVTSNSAYVAGINPLKIYEFLAAGIPCLATRWPELERIGAHDLILADREEFPNEMDRALEAPRDPTRCRAFAASASWDSRLVSLAERIGLAL